jgi:hypothetical protein
VEFKLNLEEIEAAKLFIEKHPPHEGHSNGCLSYIFTPTGIGTTVTIRCNTCGEELDITDYSYW